MTTNKIELNSRQHAPAPVTVIEPLSGWIPLKLRELWHYRDLFYFLVWRDVKVRDAQSILGVGWAVIQPVFSMVVFTIVFGNLAKVSSDGVPYAVFSYTALVPWTYFSGALSGATSSLIGASGMLTKVYFPRLIIPLAPVLAKLVDSVTALVIAISGAYYFRRMERIFADVV